MQLFVMKTDTFIINGNNLETIEMVLKAKYSRLYETSIKSNEKLLLLIEKIYFRISTEVSGVVLTEIIDPEKIKVQVWALGGKTGNLDIFDYGAEEHFVKEMITVIQNAVNKSKEM
jgi:hypothetical protein